MKLFQIEEPDGSPASDDTAGAAVGIDASAAVAEVAFAIGGNAATLGDREGFEQILTVPPLPVEASAWLSLLEGVRRRAERALGLPVTHAAIALAAIPGAADLAALHAAAAAAGIDLLRVISVTELGDGSVLSNVAGLAEDLAPVPEAPSALSH